MMTLASNMRRAKALYRRDMAEMLVDLILLPPKSWVRNVGFTTRTAPKIGCKIGAYSHYNVEIFDIFFFFLLHIQ